MNLKTQPRPRRTSKRASRAASARRAGARPRGRQARRPGVPLRRRIGARLPSLGRFLAVVGAVAATAALVALLNGPWLRVSAVAWSGERYTPDAELAGLLEGQRGARLLAVDTEALRVGLEDLPSVESAHVEATLAGRVEATIAEPAVAFVWESPTTRYLGAADGTIFAAEPRDAEPDPALADVPRVVDERFAARRIVVGDRIPRPLLDAGLRILAVDPATLGSTATHIAVRLDDEFGFRLVSDSPAWQIALGMYGVDPNETAADATARFERQVTAVRTLFASRLEAEIGWVDVRNPGKVYFRAKG